MNEFIVKNFTMHGSSGHSVLASNWLDWIASHQGMAGCSHDNGYGFGQLTYYSWEVNGTQVTAMADHRNWWLLPDASGFIVLGGKRSSSNCVLLDVFGKEKVRLIVPWELTRRDIPLGAEMWFRNVSPPYVNPETGEEGQFGVSAWIEYAGLYYFELDYHTGKFLWSKEIRD